MSESLREQLTAALDTAETEVIETPEIQEAQTDEVQADSRERDEFGRFKAKESVPEQEADPEPWRAPPKSWRKELHEKYQKIAELDPEAAKYLHEREQQFTKGVTDYKTRAEQIEAEVRPLKEVQAEFGERLQQLGGASQAFRQFLELDRMLLTGSPQQKAAIIASMAQSVGVPLDGTVQIPLQDQTIYPLQQRLQTLEQQLEAQQIGAAQARVDQFASSQPYWDEQIEADMALLIQTGRVLGNDLQSAYDMAVRLNQEAFERVNAERNQRSQAQQAAARARAAAVSPRSATPTASVSVADAGNLRQMLEAQFNATGGRI